VHEASMRAPPGLWIVRWQNGPQASRPTLTMSAAYRTLRATACGVGGLAIPDLADGWRFSWEP
jgi:hypothetical protein